MSGKYGSGPELFWSCCAMFVAQPQHIRRQPRSFYRDGLRELLRTHMISYYTGRWFEFSWYYLWHDDKTQQKLSNKSLYVEIDDVYAEVFDVARGFEDLHRVIEA
ncbi:hypothetical protein GUITHDRAFT_115977 [Guillardia theta CCMP2712]|uniref:Uncharacterized protein n=1 Tax=Guillardia theta (strain CCMP2712) TaxID=905079 RepID=L1IP57_GUITC|nr:hypothetical protein GUITHDRAFT_115977 [Guillardia theta CCMP2712]EKX37837.1 hypothetical protein GUITHDRAFT_115977 [Guillardia theta CCMP2712]|eukprot:XP_005824817.1 hypothetical protein GUITHDRAFT_115977 [Guillardia theta CCMP2712]